MIVTEKMKVVCAITILALALGVASTYVHLTKNANTNATTNSLSVTGKVVGIVLDENEIILDTPSGKKTAEINPTTKIEKLISEKNAIGIIDKQIPIEINVTDLAGGETVTVFYLTEKYSMLIGVSRVVFFVYGNVAEEYLKSQAANQYAYINGKVVSISVAEKNLVYKPNVPSGMVAENVSVTIPNGIPVYRVSEVSRATFTHARTNATLADIKVGDTIVVMINNKDSQNKTVVPKALIISDK